MWWHSGFTRNIFISLYASDHTVDSSIQQKSQHLCDQRWHQLVWLFSLLLSHLLYTNLTALPCQRSCSSLTDNFIDRSISSDSSCLHKADMFFIYAVQGMGWWPHHPCQPVLKLELGLLCELCDKPFYLFKMFSRHSPSEKDAMRWLFFNNRDRPIERHWDHITWNPSENWVIHVEGENNPCLKYSQRFYLWYR